MKILKWIKALLNNLRQIVQVDGVKSDRATALSGISQSSVL